MKARQPPLRQALGRSKTPRIGLIIHANSCYDFNMKPIIPQGFFGDATPEDLARALLRRRVVKPVVSDKVSVKEVPTDKAGDRIPHLGKRP